MWFYTRDARNPRRNCILFKQTECYYIIRRVFFIFFFRFLSRANILSGNATRGVPGRVRVLAFGGQTGPGFGFSQISAYFTSAVFIRTVRLFIIIIIIIWYNWNSQLLDPEGKTYRIIEQMFRITYVLTSSEDVYLRYKIDPSLDCEFFYFSAVFPRPKI